MSKALEEQFYGKKLENRWTTYENPFFQVQQSYLEKVNRLLEKEWINKKAIPKAIEIAIKEWQKEIEMNLPNMIKNYNSRRFWATISASNDDDSYIEKNVA